MVGLGASACVLACESGQIEVIDDFDHKACQVILREPVIYRGRQQIVCFAVGDDEIGHGARFRATLSKLVHLGKYWRSSPLVFSLSPRSQEW